MDVKQIVSGIVQGDLTNDELDQIIDAVKFARSTLARTNKQQFRVGTEVKFTSRRTGSTYRGTVEKVKVKYVLVSTPQGRYNVPANMLESV